MENNQFGFNQQTYFKDFMHYLHIKNLEEYNPGYKDRELYWCKAHFKMLNADPEFELLCEIDKWRFLAFIMLEMQVKKPIPLDEAYLRRKGFDFKARSLKSSITSMINSIEICNDLMKTIEIVDVTEDLKVCTEEINSCAQIRVEKRRLDKKREECLFDFETLWIKYPSKIGKDFAFKHFKASVRSEKDYQDIQTALENYIKSERVTKGYIQNGSTWFNNWHDWVVPPINLVEASPDGIPNWMLSGAKK